MAPRTKFSVLLLAGSRGEADPVAAGCGVSHKALAPLDGKPMIEHVLETLEAWEGAGEILVVCERDDLLETSPVAARLRRVHRIRHVQAERSPSASVLRGLALAGEGPVLLTTADHPLLTPAMIDEFLAGIAPGVDVAALVARDATIQREHPTTARTYLRFSDAAVSGCNLFAVMTPRGWGAVRFWSRLERERKQPWKMARELGLPALLRFVTRTLPLGAAIEALGAKADVHAAVVESSYAEAAIDVDKMSDHALVERILRGRRGARRAA